MSSAITSLLEGRGWVFSSWTQAPPVSPKVLGVFRVRPDDSEAHIDLASPEQRVVLETFSWHRAVPEKKHERGLYVSLSLTTCKFLCKLSGPCCSCPACIYWRPVSDRKLGAKNLEEALKILKDLSQPQSISWCLTASDRQHLLILRPRTSFNPKCWMQFQFHPKA